jgi:hypothetical protein
MAALLRTPVVEVNGQFRILRTPAAWRRYQRCHPRPLPWTRLPPTARQQLARLWADVLVQDHRERHAGEPRRRV